MPAVGEAVAESRRQHQVDAAGQRQCALAARAGSGRPGAPRPARTSRRCRPPGRARAGRACRRCGRRRCWARAGAGIARRRRAGRRASARSRWCTMPTNTPVAAAGQRRPGRCRVLERLPGDLEQQAVLRVHGGRLARRDAEEARRRSRRRRRGSRRGDRRRRVALRASGPRASVIASRPSRSSRQKASGFAAAGEAAADADDGDRRAGIGPPAADGRALPWLAAEVGHSASIGLKSNSSVALAAGRRGGCSRLRSSTAIGESKGPLEQAGAPGQAPRVGVAEDLRRLGGDDLSRGTRFRGRRGPARRRLRRGCRRPGHGPAGQQPRQSRRTEARDEGRAVDRQGEECRRINVAAASRIAAPWAGGMVPRPWACRRCRRSTRSAAAPTCSQAPQAMLVPACPAARRRAAMASSARLAATWAAWPAEPNRPTAEENRMNGSAAGSRLSKISAA